MAKKRTHKHLTLDDRITILTEIRKNTPLVEISKKIGKDPTTISKEVKLHRYCKNYDNPPSSYTHCYFCGNNVTCNKTKTGCKTCINLKQKVFCKNCRFNISIYKTCENFIERKCTFYDRWPYTCQGCNKTAGCRIKHYFYDPKMAQNEYEKTLKESREGIDSTTTSFKALDKIITKGVQDGKSIYSILINHPEIDKSERTIYRYISNRYLGVKDIDLRNKVKMKPRKQYKEAHIDKKIIDDGRSYSDYINFITKNPSCHGTQLDLVIGKIDDNQLLMTLIFPFSNLMLMYLIPNKEAKTIVEVFDDIEKKIGFDNFKMIFPYILTDRGKEFALAEEIETSKITNKKRTNLFYCNPYSSSQKAQIERNHEFIRYYYPKGKSLNDLSNENLKLMASHINSYPRESKNDNTPYNISLILFGKQLLDILEINYVAFDDIILNNSLFKQKA